MKKKCVKQGVALIASVVLAGCTHPRRPAEQSVTLHEASTQLESTGQVRGVWLKNPGYYDAETTGAIGIKKLMQQCGGFVPVDKTSKFPSCFYIIRSIDEIFDQKSGTPIKYPFDGRRAVRPDGSIVVEELPDIEVPPDYFVWFGWILL
jgi:hypothetical protein